uniref:Uncharacterized protein n=1 Tax=Steinernema glaseri TaxID=37863 RepID=A0A1I7Y5Q3_9BILA
MCSTQHELSIRSLSLRRQNTATHNINKHASAAGLLPQQGAAERRDTWPRLPGNTDSFAETKSDLVGAAFRPQPSTACF